MPAKGDHGPALEDRLLPVDHQPSRQFDARLSAEVFRPSTLRKVLGNYTGVYWFSLRDEGDVVELTVHCQPHLEETPDSIELGDRRIQVVRSVDIPGRRGAAAD